MRSEAPAFIQAHGCLVAVHADRGVVAHITENAPEFFGLGAAEAIGRSVSALFIESHGLAVVSEAITRFVPKNPLHVTSRSGVALEATAHRAGGMVILEVERRSPAADLDVATLTRSLSNLRRARTPTELARAAANEIREISDFDHVVIHRFNADRDAAEVVAEAKRDERRAFAGVVRPRGALASARALFVRDSWGARLPVAPSTEVDTTHAHLRSAAPAHLEHLRAIGARASMSVALTDGHELIGLLTGHHYAGPKPLTHAVRESVECLAATLASGMASFDRRDDLDRLRASNQELVEADGAKDKFIATIAHELRTPLNTISGWSRMILDVATSDGRRREGMQVVARNADVLAKLVDDLLDVSRIAAGNIPLDVENVDAAAIVLGVTRAMALAAEAKNIRLESASSAGPTIIVGDAARIRQVVTNLVSNAIKFTPDDGSVTITLAHEGSSLEIAVRDTGAGIAADDLPHVFDAYWQGQGTARRARGLGLGLAIAKKLVELHGGRISVASEGVGRGSTFRVRLPLAVDGAPSAVKSATSPREERRLRGMRAVVVEDEPDSRELVRYILEREGATVRAFGTGADALAALRAESFDVIISDVGMPEMDGMQLMATIRSDGGASAQTPAVALTAYASEHDRSSALHSGFQAHVGKPADADELIAVVASVVKRSIA